MPNYTDKYYEKIEVVTEMYANGFSMIEIFNYVQQNKKHWKVKDIRTLYKYLKKGLDEATKEYLGEGKKAKANKKEIIKTELKSYLSRYKKAFYGEKDHNGFWITRPDYRTANMIKESMIDFMTNKCGIDLNIYGDQTTPEEGATENIVTQILREIVPQKKP